MPAPAAEAPETSASQAAYDSNLLLARQHRAIALAKQQIAMKDLLRRQAAHEAQLAYKERKEHTATVSHTQPEPAQVESKQLTAELPVEEKPTERQPELKSSGMIFPQLDKESPESSTHEAFTAQPESPVSVKSTIARTLTVASEEEFFEDAESVALHSDDDGFMTDEEYDILDASDEEVQ
jgi:next-to-BRCA1 protein 1